MHVCFVFDNCLVIGGDVLADFCLNVLRFSTSYGSSLLLYMSHAVL